MFYARISGKSICTHAALYTLLYIFEATSFGYAVHSQPSTSESERQHAHYVQRKILATSTRTRLGLPTVAGFKEERNVSHVTNTHASPSQNGSVNFLSQSKPVPMVAATSASESDLSSLIDMLSILRRYSGNLKLIVFDLDLSDHFKAKITEKDSSVEIRKLPIGMCRTSQMVHSL